jgi:hypothetical protein
VPEKRPPRCAVIPPAQPGLQRMRGASERGEAVKAQHGRQTPRLQAVPQRLLAVMSQGTVVVRRRGLMGRYGRRQLRPNRTTGIVLVKPMGHQRPPPTRQTGRDADHLGARGNRRRA